MRNHRIMAVVAAGAIMPFAGSASAAEMADVTSPQLEKCMQTALDTFGGTVKSLKYKSEGGLPVYDLDVMGADDLLWEVECNAENGHIKEIEREVEKDNPLFADRASVSERDAQEIATRFFPGTVVSTEYELESDGTASYEFDIELAGGGLISIEVDAETGEMSGGSIIHWKIGEQSAGPGTAGPETD